MAKRRKGQTIQWPKEGKDRQYNGQKKERKDNTMAKRKKEKRKNNDLQNITYNFDIQSNLS
jgi:hypothetical protein